MSIGKRVLRQLLALIMVCVMLFGGSVSQLVMVLTTTTAMAEVVDKGHINSSDDSSTPINTSSDLSVGTFTMTSSDTSSNSEEPISETEVDTSTDISVEIPDTEDADISANTDAATEVIAAPSTTVNTGISDETNISTSETLDSFIVEDVETTPIDADAKGKEADFLITTDANVDTESEESISESTDDDGSTKADSPTETDDLTDINTAIDKLSGGEVTVDTSIEEPICIDAETLTDTSISADSDVVVDLVEDKVASMALTDEEHSGAQLLLEVDSLPEVSNEILDTADVNMSLLGDPVTLMSTAATVQPLAMTPVFDVAELQAAIAAANDNDTISLASGFSDDITGLIISNGKIFTLDLGDNTLTSSDSSGVSTAFITITNKSGLTLTGGTINRGNGHEGNLVRVMSGGQLTLENVTLDGKSDLGLTGDALVYATSATVNITDGAIITNNKRNTTNYSNGGGVYIEQNAKLVMDGGEVSHNTTSGSGGGIYVSSDNNTDAIISGGKIINNEAGWGGGIDAQSTLTIEGGEISGNKALHFGGGVQVPNMLLMSGGIISDNTAGSGGGGLFIYQGRSDRETMAIIQGGTISGNMVTSGDGGGIKLGRDSWLGITSGEISGNKALMGGGVSSSGSISITGGKISGNIANSAVGHGGGIFSDSLLGGGIVNMTGGEISSNIASDEGGGIYARGGAITIENGIIKDNTAEHGGGISVFSSLTYFVGQEWKLPVTLTIKGGVISGNEAVSSYGRGGGIHIMENETVEGTYTISGGTISGNKAITGGGVSIFYGSLIMAGGIISGNEAVREGGGIHASPTRELRISGGEIKSNTAGKAGDDVVSASGALVTLPNLDGWYWDKEGARARDGAGEALTDIPTGGSIYLAFDPSVTVVPPTPMPTPTQSQTPKPESPLMQTTSDAQTFLDTANTGESLLVDPDTGHKLQWGTTSLVGWVNLITKLRNAGIDESIINACRTALLDCEDEMMRDLILLVFNKADFHITTTMPTGSMWKDHPVDTSAFGLDKDNNYVIYFYPGNLSAKTIFHEIGHLIDALMGEKNGFNKGKSYSGTDKRYDDVYINVKENVEKMVTAEINRKYSVLTTKITKEYVDYLTYKIMNENVPGAQNAEEKFGISDALKNVLRPSYEAVLNLYTNNKIVATTEKSAYKEVVSDAYGGITGNNIADGSKHSDDYWYNDLLGLGVITTVPNTSGISEIWAEYVSAIVRNIPHTDKIINDFFPSYKAKALKQEMYMFLYDILDI